MALIKVIMPKMGESITEATILSWSKQIGDRIEEEETLLEIATDKVDSEIPSPASGFLKEIYFEVDAVVPVGEIIALINSEASDPIPTPAPETPEQNQKNKEWLTQPDSGSTSFKSSKDVKELEKQLRPSSSDTFYSPLVRSIAAKENVGPLELGNIKGTGNQGRVTKADLLEYIASRRQESSIKPELKSNIDEAIQQPALKTRSLNGDWEIIEMDRTRRLIADHMVRSKKTSAHVTSFLEVDVTTLVNWRNRVKETFSEKYHEKITFTPIFIEAVVNAIQDFPMINASVEENNILIKKNINIGMATALPSGNLIVPVIKNADHLNLIGLTKQVNHLAKKARANQLKPDDIQGGTFTLTNVGIFGNTMGTPIINQPQVAILSTGSIKKKPAVLETEEGDVIAIRQMMFLSLSYDHRIIDGYLGGSFLRRIGDYLEGFDGTRKV